MALDDELGGQGDRPGDSTWAAWARPDATARPTWLDEPAPTGPPLTGPPLAGPPLAEDSLGPPAGVTGPASPRDDLLPPAPMPATSGPRWLPAALVGGLIGALVAAGVSAGIYTVLDDDSARPAATRASSRLAGEQLDIRGVLEAVRPGVVSIEERGIRGAGAGTGMVIEADGLVLTNAHVVAGAQTIMVTLENGDRKPADLVGSFEDNDVALIKIRDVRNLPTVRIGSSSSLQVGDEVVAVGNALDLGAEPTVTRGIVSALERSLEAQQIVLRHLIQTDAAINPGNSGGPLVNAAGEVVGVNTAIAAQGQNIGFALAIDSIKPLIQGIKDGKATVAIGPLLGVSTRDLDTVVAQVRERYGIKRENGAFVQEVVADSGAAKAGLLAGDVIVAVDGKPVAEAADVGDLVADRKPGQTVSITYERAGERTTASAILGAREVSQGGR